MQDKEALAAQIDAAFAQAQYPGDQSLRGSREGDEPFLLEDEFKGKTDWRTLDPAFLDLAPDGYATALSFFSDEAFRFYLPAYLIADLRGQLQRVTPVFYLTHGLDEASRSVLINPRRYGDQTWRDYARQRFAAFSREEAQGIVAYLIWKRETDWVERSNIDEALECYWSARAI
jgi:Family of unknown function (DUF6714)